MEEQKKDEQIKEVAKEAKAPESNEAPKTEGAEPTKYESRRANSKFRKQGGKFNGKGGKRPFKKREPKEFESKMIDLARVTRVTGGGKAMSFRAAIVLGNGKGKIGFGVAKGKDVQQANEKATRYAKKDMFTVPIVDGTIPHRVLAKAGASYIMMKPQYDGRGVVAGGAARVVCNLAGIKNVTAKYLGVTKNSVNNARAAVEALRALKPTKVKKEEKKPAIAVEK